MPRRNPHRFDVSIERSDDLLDLARSFAGISHARLVEGNEARVIQDGAFFDALVTACAAATSSIHIENYLWKPGRVFDRFTDTLDAAARRGVEVRVIYDALGAVDGTERRLEQLRDAGSSVVRHRKFSIPNMTRISRRDHRKLAVIDGRVAFIFGHGISDEWDLSAATAQQWRDTAVRLEGPIVTELQSSFFETWIELTGTAMAARRYFPEQPRRGAVAAYVAYVTPVGVRSAVQRLHYLAIQAARRQLTIQNPYFIPDAVALRYFREALARGVRVRIMLPKAAQTDYPLVQHASHHFFGSMLRAGAEILEYGRSGLHQKVVIVDGEWCCAGSTNFDARSFRRNDEITVALFDAAVAADLERAFDRDVLDSEPWNEQRWGKRSRTHQLADFAAALLRGQL